MPSMTPHRDAVQKSIAEMKARYDALPPATVEADKHSRALTAAITEAVMLRLADVDDARGDVEAFAQGFTHAVGNVVATVASCLAQGDAEMTKGQAFLLVTAITGRTRMRVEDPTRGMIVMNDVDIGGQPSVNGGPEASC